ncbi:methyl-accepting chemotaxis protein [Salinibacillus xinjiangensis]|uniref:HAMP domain-containing protein n=1 Tax=Salinibacillus xinjiangensis TaxID=1229268 RepID=A0A6G1X277_9BACI|nr:methyl-accepting chemotaxis protein [Salinibacillus xinjiangensis]MRG85039.1 HAMP domain-containing protein [Salinibacillus xinjiangensis]
MTRIKEGKPSKTLKKQFTIRVLCMMLSVALIAGSIQLVIMKDNLDERVLREANSISNSIEQGISETDLAAKEIEHQIDLKLESYSKYIAEELDGRPIDAITNEDLMVIRNSLGISGITLFQRTGNDLVGVRATESEEIGFSMKKANPQGFEALDSLIDGVILDGVEQAFSYVTNDTAILFTSHSGSHEGEPLFFKYAYYHPPGTDYLIDPYIEANEVYQFTQKVGPDAWIEQVINKNEYAEEIAVLDPRVFKDPSLSEKIYPPLEKVVNGEYGLQDDQDTDLLIQMMDKKNKQSYIKQYDGREIYKAFLPMENGKVIYVALDYTEMKQPFYKQLFILISTSLLSLIVLFMLTTRFFNRIYANIQKIIEQILKLEKGDFTAKSHVADKGELGRLSESANRMASTLNQVISETNKQATQTERHAYLLESEANNSVEKVYTMSMEATTTAREFMNEIDEFLSRAEEALKPIQSDQSQEILNQIRNICELAKDNSNSATEMTITLADLLKSLHGQSEALSEISKKLLQNMEQFNLNSDDNQK